MERLLDKPVELGRQASVETRVLPEEEEIRGPFVQPLRKLVSPLVHETLELVEPPAPCARAQRRRAPPNLLNGRVQ